MALGGRAGAMRLRLPSATSFERQSDRAVIADARTYTSTERQKDRVALTVAAYSPERQLDRASPAIRYRSLDRQSDRAAPSVTPAFANGFRFRRAIVPASFAPAGVLLVSETLASLKSASNGGQVQSTLGWDIRCEDGAGNKVAHTIDSYAPTTGRLVLWVRQPVAWLYYGKTGLTATEENPAGMAVDFAVWWSGLTGTDLTGQTGRSLAPTAGVSATTLGEFVAGLYNGTTGLATAAAAWSGFTGLSSLTLDVYCQASAIGQNRGLFIQGTKAQNVSSIALYWRSATAAGLANPIIGNIRGATAAGFVVSGTTLLNDATSAPVQDLLPMLIHLTGVSGAAPGLFVRGAAVTPSSNQVFTGVVGAQTGGMWLGDGPDVPPSFPTAGPWSGKIAFARLRAGVPSAAQAAAEWLNINQPKSTYGIGDQDGPNDTNHSPVAVPPSMFTVNGGVTTLLDVLATATDVDGATVSLAAGTVTTPGHGTATIIGASIAYTPALGYAGLDSFRYGVKDAGGKISIGEARVTVQAVTAIADLPTPIRNVQVTNYASLQQAMNAAVAGDEIDCADGTYSGNALNWSASGTAAHPIVIKANHKLAALLRCGTITLSGTYLWIYGLDMGPTIANLGGQHPGRGTNNGGGNTVKRCKFYGFSGNGSMVTLGLGNGPISDHGEVCYCDITHAPFVVGDYSDASCQVSGPARWGVNILVPHTPAKPQRHQYAWVHHNNFHDFSPKPWPPGTNIGRAGGCYNSGFNHMIRVGDATQSDTQMFALIEYNIFQRMMAGFSVIETKSCDNIFRYNTIRDCPNNGAELALRNGRRATIYGNTLINMAGGILVLDGEDPTVNTVGHIVSSNVAGSDTAGITVQAGNIAPGALSTVNSPAARNCLVVGNHAVVRVGDSPRSNSSYPAVNTTVMANTGSASRSTRPLAIGFPNPPGTDTTPERTTVIMASASTTVPGSPIVLTASDIQTYTPVLLADTDVGPNAP